MLATQNDITKYIPQRQPMVMIHNLLTATEEGATTQLKILPDNIFTENHVLTEPGLVENIAQTAAVQVGYICMQRSVPVPIGYIAAIKDLVFYNLPAENSTITTTVKIKNQVLDITLVEGEVTQNDEVLCRCEMRIFAKIQA
jgi:3-hydroxymyristoyl/3-hydroxydecanoyl-(acyl carrier protein) dehydratase